MSDTLNEQETFLWESLRHVLLCGASLADCLKNQFSEKHAERVIKNWHAAIESLVMTVKQEPPPQQ